MKEFKNSVGIFSFAKFGTMIQEHYHGLIRGMSKGVDALQNTLNCISKSNIIQDIQNQFQLNFRKKIRFSAVGVNYDNDKTDHIECNIDFSSQEIINQLDQLSVYGKCHNVDELFIPKLIFYSDEIGKNSLRIFYTKKHFHYCRRIISREITNHQELIYDKKLKNIEKEDDYEDDDADFRKDLELIDQLLNKEEDIEEDYDWNEEEEVMKNKL